MSVTQEKPSILCMFSGGIDSTGALHHLLTEEKFAERKLFVHHIHIHNRENRARAEAAAVKHILQYYKKSVSRNFVFTESTFNSTGFGPLKATRFPYDADVIAFYAANIATARKDIGQVVVGRTKTDVESGGNYSARMKRRQEIFDAVWLLEKDTKPEFFYPLLDLTKEEVWYRLPAEVRNWTWWCRTPVYKNEIAKPCGRCVTCMQVKTFLNESN
ncbi:MULTISPECIES: 7-cyano-7-deazaguanine synthase [unclassified Ekhidna]|uniref:7-cyano-7-deazaguanine synthase n=1 Tax=unclassified Ekhidna TaxID=2632188 RepID=UPI0032DFCFF1